MFHIIDLFLRSKNGLVTILLCVAILFVLKIISPDYTTVECLAKDQYCVASSNFLGFKQSKITFKPTDIVKTHIERNYVKRRSRSHYGSTVYDLYLVNKSGVRDVVIHSIEKEFQADELGTDLLYCISAQKYPCRIRKPFSWF